MPDSGSFIWLCFRYVTTDGLFYGRCKTILLLWCKDCIARWYCRWVCP